MTDSAIIERITRSLAYMLRHQPEQFDLDIDRHGFADVEDVVRALNERLGEPVEVEDLEEAVHAGDRQRYEIVDDRIRALYGHSIDVEAGEPGKPPELLYVGLSESDANRASRYGLRGGRRRFLHLALTEEDAIETGRRAAVEYAVVTVFALDAWEEGVNFYDRRSLFLAEEIPTRFIEVGEVLDDGVGPRRREGDGSDRDRDRERGRGRGRGRGGRERGGRGRDRDRDRGRDRAPDRAPDRDRDDAPARDREPARDRDTIPRRDPRADDRGGRGRERGGRDRDSRGGDGGREPGADRGKPRRESAATAVAPKPHKEPARESRSAEPEPSGDFGLGIFEEKKQKEKEARRPQPEPEPAPRPAPEPPKAAPEPKEPPPPSGPGFGAGL